MNDFSKEELIEILDYCNWSPPGLGFSDFRVNLWNKIQSMIDNYSDVDIENIVKSHLSEAESLISHAKCLLGIDDDNK